MRYHLPAASLLAAAVLFSDGAIAQDLTCLTRIDDFDVRGNLNIPGRCELRGTVVRGNVILFSGGALIARDARIHGNVEGNRADFVDIGQSRIDGNLRLDGLVGDLSVIERTEIRGNARLSGNRSRIELLDNELTENVEVLQNTGGVEISQNEIGGNLACAGNTPAPTGVGNRIRDDASGQCANLTRAPTTPDSSPPSPSAEPPPTTARPTTPPPTPSPPARPPTETPPALPRPPTGSPPANTPPAPATPPPASPPPSSPPTPMPPPTASPPDSTSSPTTSTPPTLSPPSDTLDPEAEEGGGGAIDWTMLALLFPLLARRSAAREQRRALPDA